MAAASSSSSLQHTVTVFLVISLFLSATPHARESHFFSKVTKDDEIPPTFDQKQQTNTNNEPTFVPETSDGHSYGLYGHESGQSSPGASDQTHAYKTTFSDSATDSNSNSLAGTHKYSNDLPYGESLYSNNQEQSTYEQQYKDSYLTEEERARRSGVTYTTTSSDDDDITNQMENSYNNGKKQQGLSDTRFMEGGKYFYDVNNEEPTYTRNPTLSNNEMYYNRQNGNGRYNANKYRNSNYVYNSGNEAYEQNNQEEFQEEIHP